MAERDDDSKPQARAVASCPWCGSGTKLSVSGDGFGGTLISCLNCGCKGPAVAIGEDFATSDEQAIRRWSTRPRPRIAVPGDLLRRVHDSIALQTLMGSVEAGTPVSLPYGDLALLLSAIAPQPAA
ncbi:MAG: Lar family restriction alleviation protein [Sphingomonas sp.]